MSASFVGFPPDVILLAVRWYLRDSLSQRGIAELLAERGVDVDHVIVHRWVHRFTPLMIDAARPCRHSAGDRWFVDDTHAKLARIVVAFRAPVGMARLGPWPRPAAPTRPMPPSPEPAASRWWCPTALLAGFAGVVGALLPAIDGQKVGDIDSIAFRAGVPLGLFAGVVAVALGVPCTSRSARSVASEGIAMAGPAPQDVTPSERADSTTGC